MNCSNLSGERVNKSFQQTKPLVTPRQGADVAVFEGPLQSEGDLDRLFAGGGHSAAALALQGDMDDAKTDLGSATPGRLVDRHIRGAHS